MKYKVTRPDIAQPSDKSIRLIALTRGQVATVDVHWYELLMQWNWQAQWAENTQSFYAVRHKMTPDDYYGCLPMHSVICPADHPLVTDHFDGDTLNNREQNLIKVTRSQNKLKSKLHSSNTTGYRGVWKKGGRFASTFRAKGKREYLGTFDSAEEASRVYESHRESHLKIT